MLLCARTITNPDQDSILTHEHKTRFKYQVVNGILVKQKFVALILLMMIVGASGFLYLESMRERDRDLAITEHEDDESQPEDIEQVEESEPQPEEAEEDAESQPEEDDVAPEEELGDQNTRSIDDFEFTARPAPGIMSLS